VQVAIALEVNGAGQVLAGRHCNAPTALFHTGRNRPGDGVGVERHTIGARTEVRDPEQARRKDGRTYLARDVRGACPGFSGWNIGG